MLRLSRRARRVLRFIRRYAWQLSIVLGLMIVGTALDLIFPKILADVIDQVLAPRDLAALAALDRGPETKLLQFVVLIVILSLVRIVLGAVQGYMQAWVASHITFDMRNNLFAHLQTLPMRFYARTKTGDILSRLNGDITEIQSVATGALVGFVISVLNLIGTIGFLVYYSWKLFLITSLITPLAAFALTRFRDRIQDVAKQVREATAELANLTIESLSGMRFVRALGAERFEFAKYQNAGKSLIQTLLRYQLVSAFGGGLPGALLIIGAAIALYFGGSMVLAGTLTVGGLTAFAIYQGRLFGPIQGLMGMYMRIQRARASLDRVFEYLDLEPETPDRPDAISPGKLAGKIELERVRFGYEDERPVLDDVSLTIAPGERVALVGQSGTGKSTIVDLLWRFYHPSAGRVLVDGHDIRDLKVRELIEQMVVVSQEPYLFNASLADNIRYGRPDATDDELQGAVVAADLGELVAALELGLDTEVGERGLVLSTGQRQRVALARAFLRRPRILVLDEATSALDWISEDAVRRSMDALMQGTTTLIITHRLSRARDADRIFVLDQGRIVEQGRHPELVASGGLYATLLAHESGTAGKQPAAAPSPTAAPAPAPAPASAPAPVTGTGLMASLTRGPRIPGDGSGVRVAIIDSGANVPHPHIGRVTAGVAVRIDDGQAILDRDFRDLNGHGTAAAALFSYLAPNAELVAIKIFDRELRTTQEHLRAAIRFAIDQGCRVINCSLGTPAGDHTRPLEEVCNEALASGAIIVAATPNGQVSYPSAFDSVIAVAEDRALGDDDLVRGTDTAEFLASGYARPRPGLHPEVNFKGSSFAAARVASVVARIVEQTPEADLEQVRSELKGLCVESASG